MLGQGHLLNSYQIQSVIGHGGFGVVYKGIHRELESDVAIKEYFPSELCIRQDNVVVHSKPEFQSAFDENLNRFIKEAQQLQKFRSSPNIVTCTDLFRANGTAYIVMEYVDGLPLSVLLERRESHGKPFTEQDMLQVILPLLNALQTVHELGVCHRDIKPSNILIRSSDSTPVLIDFGAAKHEISRDTKSFAPYSDGYAAMEQIGEGEIGTWTDIYGIGALMWRMVAGGNPPYSPPNPHSSQKRAFELMQGRRDPLPSAVEIGGRQFSERTLLTIDNCLAINVRDRIQDCAQLLESLNNEDNIDRDAPQNFASQGEKNDINSDSLHQTTAQPFRKKSGQKKTIFEWMFWISFWIIHLVPTTFYMLGIPLPIWIMMIPVVPVSITCIWKLLAKDWLSGRRFLIRYEKPIALMFFISLCMSALIPISIFLLETPLPPWIHIIMWVSLGIMYICLFLTKDE